MSARIVLVHDEVVFVRSIELGLRDAGYEVETFDNTMSAIDRLERPEHVDLLITRTRFPQVSPMELRSPIWRE